MEVLVCLSIALSAALFGYAIAENRYRRKVDEDLAAKTKTLNTNLDSFAKAFADFAKNTTEIDTRLDSLEFRVNGAAAKINPGSKV